MLTCRIKLRSIANAVIGFAALLACGMAAADPPARVARLANIGGAVSFAPAGEDEWVYATPNRPLITGDRVWADAGARAELQIGSLAVRLGSQTSITILNLDDRVAQFQLAQGALNVHVRRLDPGQTIEIDTPLLAFSLRRPGDYRIDVDPASAATTVAVRSGEGEVYGEGAAYVISARQWYRFADSGLRDYQYDALPPPDAFDSWARDRDRREDNPVAARYVSPDVIGYSDLDDYGTWSVVEGYGNVWVPTSVASDWAPYHHGHWTWIEPWGWTWVDDAPWGFAPFHYGRWAYARQRWCWVPGPVRVRPVYAPALVAFVGGNNFRISVGTGGPTRGVAWFPLAPGEVYRPAYRVSRNYFTNVNISNTNVSNTYVTNVYNKPDSPNTVYRNREQRGGMTVVPAAAFVQSRPVAQSAVAVSREVAAAAPVTPVAAIAPVRASVIGGGATPAAGGAPAGPGTVSRPPTATIQRPVVARVAPPPPPAPFTAREATLAKDPGRPADPATVVAARPSPTAAPPVKVVAPAAPGTPPPAPTISRPRTNVPPTAPGGAPPAAAGTPPSAPAAGVAPGRPALSAPQPPGPPPVSRDGGGPVPKADISPPPAPPSAVRVPPAPPPVQSAPQPPKAIDARPAPQPPPTATQPPVAPTPAPAELRREPPPPPMVNRPPVTQSPPAELRREPPPPPAVAKPPPAPSPPAELRREPPPAPAAVRPPPAPLPPPAELRREPPPPPVVAKPPVVATPPAAVPAAPATVRQPEPKAKVEPAKGEAPKAKAEEKRDEPK